MRRGMTFLGIFFIILGISAFLVLPLAPAVGCALLIASPVFIVLGVILLIFGIFRE